jgi:plastocyanin
VSFKIITGIIFATLLLLINSVAYAKPTSIGASIVSEASKLNDKAFQPNPITIKQGDTVVWTNNDFGTHTVTEKKATFNSGYMRPNQTFEFTFNKSGIFEYICEVHPTSMFGTVIVNP